MMNNNTKPFNFKITIDGKASGFVWAKSKEAAKEYILKKQWDELYVDDIDEVIDIIELEEEED